MKIKLSINKSVDENAQDYFEAAKKARKKLKGAKKILEEYRKKAVEEEERLRSEKAERIIDKERRGSARSFVEKKFWFEKFRWFFTSDGFLVIGGRDATTNEIIIKKHTEPKDLVFHTDMAGSPFIVLKARSDEGAVLEEDHFPKSSIEEGAIFTATYSRAWKNNMTSLDVFFVKPDQVSKKANSGEYLGKGSFMIRGKTNYLKPELELAIGKVFFSRDNKILSVEEAKELMKENDSEPESETLLFEKLMAGPISALKRYSEEWVLIRSSSKKNSDTAKEIKRLIGFGDLDKILSLLPSGGSEVVRKERCYNGS